MRRQDCSAVLALLLAACTPARSKDAAAPPQPPAVAKLAPPPHTPALTGPYAKPSEEDLRMRLTPLAFAVTQRGATEPSFHNAYWNNHEDGLYVDVATGEPLFSSRDKFESGTGWPSFTRPVDPESVIAQEDESFGMSRTEVVSRAGSSHLGHVFGDGPAPGHKRYCINSAALRFVPAGDLAAAGYAAYAERFASSAEATPTPATSNSCTLPPPGEKPGCSATLETAIFVRSPARPAREERLGKATGVLGVVLGYEGNQPAAEVTFDPAAVTYPALLATWIAGAAPGDGEAIAFVQGDAQRSAAKAHAGQVREVEAVPFRRQ